MTIVFQPERLGVEVYIGNKYDRMWTNKAIEAVFYKFALEDEALIGEMAKLKAPRAKEKKRLAMRIRLTWMSLMWKRRSRRRMLRAKRSRGEGEDVEAEEIGEDVEEDIDVEAEE